MKINLKNLKNFKQGVTNLTPEQQLNVTKVSGLGGFIGLSIALISMILSLVYAFSWKTLGFTVFVAFIVPMQWVQYRNASNQIKQLNAVPSNEELERMKKILGD